MRVSDDGIGMAPETLDTLFTSFAQAQASTTRLFGGTGLGLAIVKHLVQAHGGEVSVTSTIGQGSEFRFTLPVSAQQRENGVENLALDVAAPAAQQRTG